MIRRYLNLENHSSVFLACGYDVEKQVLRLQFKSKLVYEYRPVPPLLYLMFVNAKSLGTFFNKEIKPYYVGKEVKV